MLVNLGAQPRTDGVGTLLVAAQLHGHAAEADLRTPPIAAPVVPHALHVLAAVDEPHGMLAQLGVCEGKRGRLLGLLPALRRHHCGPPARRLLIYRMQAPRDCLHAVLEGADVARAPLPGEAHRPALPVQRTQKKNSCQRKRINLFRSDPAHRRRPRRSPQNAQARACATKPEP